jgi:hypothetical protein
VRRLRVARLPLTRSGPPEIELLSGLGPAHSSTTYVSSAVDPQRPVVVISFSGGGVWVMRAVRDIRVVSKTGADGTTTIFSPI